MARVLALLAVLGVLGGAGHAFAGEWRRDNPSNPNAAIEIPIPRHDWREERRDGHYDRSGHWREDDCDDCGGR
jgi:hypothetical protein